MTPDTPHDPKGAAGKLKPQLHLLPPIFCTETAAALSDGARKYGAWNFRRSRVIRSTYTSAILRHVMAIQNGEDRCPESGVTHLGHIAANCAILLDAEACGTLEDDRVLATPDRVSPRPPASAADIRQAMRLGFMPTDDEIKLLAESDVAELLSRYAKQTKEWEVKWHDPDNVGDPGEGFRFLTVGETTIPGDGEVWFRRKRSWGPSMWIGGQRNRHRTYRTRQPLPSPVKEEPPTPQDNLPAINQSLRETIAAHGKTIAELGELLRKKTEERDAALAAVRPVEWHNPAGVDSPGEDFRFLLKTEVVVPEDGEVWNTKDRWSISGNRGDVRHEPSTYRTRQPLPTV